MQIIVSSRHQPAVMDAARQRAHLVLDRLGRLAGRALEGTAVFDVVAGRAWVELRLRLSGGTLLVATAAALDHRSALDLVEEKVRRQVRRTLTRPLAHRHAVS